MGDYLISFDTSRFQIPLTRLYRWTWLDLTYKESMISIPTFDTLKFVRRLKEVGVTSEQAEVQAEVLTEAFNVTLEELVTKDYLAVEFAKERAHTDVQFAEIKGNFRSLYWMNSLIILVSIVPAVQRFLSF